MNLGVVMNGLPPVHLLIVKLSGFDPIPQFCQ